MPSSTCTRSTAARRSWRLARPPSRLGLSVCSSRLGPRPGTCRSRRRSGARHSWYAACHMGYICSAGSSLPPASSSLRVVSGAPELAAVSHHMAVVPWLPTTTAAGERVELFPPQRTPRHCCVASLHPAVKVSKRYPPERSLPCVRFAFVAVLARGGARRPLTLFLWWRWLCRCCGFLCPSRCWCLLSKATSKMFS